MKSPRVSICIPTYQYARYLPQAIESVQQQTLEDFELIILDDASTDETREVLEGFAAQDSRLEWRVHPCNLGMVENWNACLALARAPYVKFLMADDYLKEPDALETLVGLLEKNPNAVLAGSSRELVDADGHRLGEWTYSQRDGIWNGRDVVRRCLLESRNWIGEPTATLFRRSHAARGFDPAYRQLVDLEMWFHLLLQGDYAHAGRALCVFRRHPEQQTEKLVAGRRHLLDNQLLLEGYLTLPELQLAAPTQRRLLYRQVRDCIRAGDREALDKFGYWKYAWTAVQYYAHKWTRMVPGLNQKSK